MTLPALILAAGRGSRLGELTANSPKGMTRLAGRPLLEWQRLALASASLDPIAAIAGYQAYQVEQVIPVAFENANWERTNMVATLACGASWLATTGAIVSYSDIAYHPDWVRRLVEAPPAPVTLTYDKDWRRLWEMRSDDPLSDAETFRVGAAGTLLEIGGRASSIDDVRGQYMGLLRILPDGWRAMAAALDDLEPTIRASIDMTSLLALLIARGTTVTTVAGSGRWVEVDTPDDLSVYEQMLTNLDRSWRHDWRWYEEKVKTL